MRALKDDRWSFFKDTNNISYTVRYGLGGHLRMTGGPSSKTPLIYLIQSGMVCEGT